MSSNIRVLRVCQHCGNEFTAKTTVTKFCSDICAKRSYKVRKRAGKIADSNDETAQVMALPLLQIAAKEFLSVKEVAQLLGVSRWTVARAVSDGRVTAARFGKRIVIKRTDIDRLFSTSNRG